MGWGGPVGMLKEGGSIKSSSECSFVELIAHAAIGDLLLFLIISDISLPCEKNGLQ